MKPDPLDPLLKGWAERMQPGAAEMVKLGARIRGSLPSDFATSAPPVETGMVFHLVHHRLAAAAALAILLGAGALLLRGFREASVSTTARNGAEEMARLTSEQVAARRVLLEETEALFAEHLRWVQLDAGGMHLELSKAAGRAEEREAGLVVRTVMLSRKDNQTDWETVWSTDILTRAEEYVEVAETTGCDGAMALWVHQLPDGRFAVDSQLHCPARGVAMPGETRILSAGRPERILMQSAGGLEFRIYQSVEPLVNGRG